MALFLFEECELDVCENYQKMSLRNRAEIATPHGQLKLSVPLLHGRNQRRPVKDVEVYNSENWLGLHFKSLQNNYRKSPYFEYFEEEINPFFLDPEKSLIAQNKASIELILKLLNFQKEILYTSEYEPETNRYPMTEISKGKVTVDFPAYQQVFMDKSGFLPNLSTLDLIFCQGPQQAIEYLKNIHQELLKL